MRFETLGLLHVLKALALIGAYVLFWRFGFDFSELMYQFGKIDWVFASFLIAPILLLLGISGHIGLQKESLNA